MPFCATLLADLGADVVRIDRLERAGTGARFDVLTRSRPSVGVDLKSPEGVEAILRLVERADALMEGFRPGVTERLGLGPDVCLTRNPKLVYARMTGWGQSGPLSETAGHDINYIALTGALHSIRRAAQRPVPPLALVGDYGGGALYLAMGILAGILEARDSGTGQVVDSAMVEGASNLMNDYYGLVRRGLLDGGAGDQHGRFRRSLLRCLRDLGRQVHFCRVDGAPVLCRADRKDGSRRRGSPRAERPGAMAHDEEALRGGLSEQDAAAVVRHHGGERCLLRAGAEHGGGSESPPERRARRPSSRSTGLSRRRPHRASAEPSRRSRGRRPRPLPTPRERFVPGASPAKRSTAWSKRTPSFRLAKPPHCASVPCAHKSGLDSGGASPGQANAKGSTSAGEQGEGRRCPSAQRSAGMVCTP